MVKFVKKNIEFKHGYPMKNEQELINILGNNVKTLRERKGWSQETLAEMTGVSRNSICEIETKKNFARADTLVKLAIAFETEVYELVKPEGMLPDKAADIIAKYNEAIKKSSDKIKDDFLRKMKK